MSRITLLTMIVAALAIASPPARAVPQNLPYQGRLTDAAGEPLTDPVNVTFTIYLEPTGGTQLWSQSFENLALDNGRFNVLLGGDEAPFTSALIENLNEGADLYLGIQVGDDPEMTPRQQIASVAYALHAALADTAEFAREAEIEHAATADTAEFAHESDHTATADTAEFAREAEVEHAASADTAAFAEESGHAAAADTAEFAREAEVEHAATADTAAFAEESGHAAAADTAEFAREAEVEHAATADTAEFARESDHAATADEVPGLPGIAYSSAHRTTFTAGTSVTAVSVTITTPADGYVLVSASGTLILDHRDGDGVLVHANIGEELDGVPEPTMGLAIASVDTADLKVNHYVPFHCQRVYEKAAGEYAFHLNVSVRSPKGSGSANRPSITAMFIPNLYGTAEIEAAGAAPLGARPSGTERGLPHKSAP